MTAAGSTRLRTRAAALVGVLCVAAAVTGCSGAEPSEGDGCANDRDLHRAQTLAALSFITSHPDPAVVVEQGSGCHAASGQIGAGREYYWENMDEHLVMAFHQAIAEKDGWKPAPDLDQVGTPSATAPTWSPSDGFLCYTKLLDGSAAYLRLYFQDSSTHGPEGTVYDVDAWFPGPAEGPGC
ncbi:hypothetical protein [Krasilnikovia sp. MM14-A1004]|uniref:hypothetical protein n=1 Tax=Krasilnikovia sp. MM14-A1004 TaxID=3373541 RepID=UPI00399C4E32